MERKTKTFIASIILLVLGFISARIGDSLSTVTESGMVVDNALMPIGALLFFLGLLALATALVWHLIDAAKRRRSKKQE